MMKISSSSLEYIKVQVTAIKNGVAYDPTGDTVTMAFTVSDVLTGVSWKTSSWETTSGKYYARCLVGTGGAAVLSAGTYIVWVRVTDSPEIPVKRAGTLEVI